jgi:hypothetical protein
MNLAMKLQESTSRWGVLMLDTQFPRWPGDIGCPDGWPCELVYQKVIGKFPQDIVRTAESLQQHAVLPSFVQAAHALERRGVDGITTSCGFLVLLQAALQSVLTVPLRTSSLLLLPHLLSMHNTVGVLTMDEKALGRAHFLAAGVMLQDLPRLRVQGVAEDEEFACAIMGNRARMNFQAAQASVVSAALKLKKKAPELQQVVLECTNMPPFTKAIEAATGWQLHSLHQLLTASSAAASK